MSWKDVFLSFGGRISRATYWQAGLAILAYLLLLFVVMAAFLSGGDAPLPERILGVALPVGILALPALYASFAIGLKRLHDRDKSGWWMLPFYVLPGLLDQWSRQLGEDAGAGLAVSLASFALSLWAIVEFGFLRGTRGANRFGADPLEPAGDVPTDAAA